MSLRKQVEDAVIARLAPLLRPTLSGGTSTGYLKAIKEYAGELAGKELADLKDKLAGQTPGLLVATGRGAYDEVSARRARARKNLDVEILVVSSNMRGLSERAVGSAGDTSPPNDPGVYAIMEDVDRVLHGVDLGITGVGVALVPTLEAPFVETHDLLVWLKKYAVPVDAIAPDPDATAPALTAIEQRVHLPVTEEIIASGVGDALAISAGVVTLTDAGANFLAGYVGLVIEIAGATTPGNNSAVIDAFVITAVPSSTMIRWTNAAGHTEAFSGVWKIRPPAQVVGDTTM